jgi:hypothetical protein
VCAMDCFELFVGQVQQITDQEQRWLQNFIFENQIIGVGFEFPPTKDLNDIRRHFEQQGLILRSEAQRTEISKSLSKTIRVVLRCSCAFRKRSRASTKKNTFSNRSQMSEASCSFRISLKCVELKQWSVTSLVNEHSFHFRYASEKLITRKSQLPITTIDLCLALFEAHTATTTIRQVLQNQGYSVTKKFLQNLRRDEFQPFQRDHLIPKGIGHTLDLKKCVSQTLHLMALLQHQKTPFVICFEVVFFHILFDGVLGFTGDLTFVSRLSMSRTIRLAL